MVKGSHFNGFNRLLNGKFPSDSILFERCAVFKEKSLADLLGTTNLNCLFRLMVSAMKKASALSRKEDFRKLLDTRDKRNEFENESDALLNEAIKHLRFKPWHKVNEILNVAINCHSNEIIDMAESNGKSGIFYSKVLTQYTDSHFKYLAAIQQRPK